MAAISEEGTLLRSDATLVDRVAAGDVGAFEELYREYSRPLAAFGSRLLRDRYAGEDIAQQSLLNAYRAIRRGTRPLHLRPWLYRIARNNAYEARRRGHGEIVDSELLEGAAPAADSEFDRELWYDALRELPTRQRDVYLLREVNGLSVTEIVDRLALTRPQVDQALFAARNKLAERLAFGGRIDCDSLQAAVRAGTVPSAGRRALKAHVRACPSCRAAMPTRRLGLFGNLGVLLRQFLQWLPTGGAAPVAVKVGAVVAAAAVTAAASPHIYRAAAAAAGLGQHTVVSASTPAAAPPDATPHVLEPSPLVALVLHRTSPPSLLQRNTSTGGSAVQSSDTIATDTTTTDTITTDTTTNGDTSTDPAATDPTATGPSATDPVATDPGTSDSTDPAATDPGTSDSTDPTATDPGTSDSTDPTATDPGATDPTATDPTATDPTATDPTATDPTVTDTTTAP